MSKISNYEKKLIHKSLDELEGIYQVVVNAFREVILMSGSLEEIKTFNSAKERYEEAERTGCVEEMADEINYILTLLQGNCVDVSEIVSDFDLQ